MRTKTSDIKNDFFIEGSFYDGMAANCVLLALDFESRSLLRFGHRFGWMDEQSECRRGASTWAQVASSVRAKSERFSFWKKSNSKFKTAYLI